MAFPYTAQHITHAHRRKMTGAAEEGNGKKEGI